MKPDDFERRIGERMRSLVAPPHLEERLVRLARSEVACPAHPRRRRAWALAVAAAASLIVGATVAGALLLRGGSGSTVPVGRDSEAAIAESGVLAAAPWLRQPTGGPHISAVHQLPSLRFPRGTRYPEALNRLLRSVVSAGTLPPGAQLVPPVPRTVVWASGATGPGPRLSLVAPWGYSVPGGRIRMPGFRLPADTPRRDAREVLRALATGHALGRPLPPGLRTEAPPLLPCQVWDAGEPPAPCALRPPKPLVD